MLKTADSIRTGVAQAKIDFTQEKGEHLDAFLRGRNTMLRTSGAVFAARYDLSACRSAIDVGGGAGGFSIALAEVYPHLRMTLADLPQVMSIAQQVLAESGVGNQIE